jgi:toxin-antitoxin system PIN domain toxin
MKKASKAICADPIFPDVNVLIALGWSNHPFHGVAQQRMTEHTGVWMTCAVTQLGFIRLSSNPAVTRYLVSPGQAAELFLRITDDAQHVYVGDSMSLVRTGALDIFRRAVGSHQVTDAYLLTMAAASRARFVTFDARLGPLAKGFCDVEVLKG